MSERDCAAVIVGCIFWLASALGGCGTGPTPTPTPTPADPFAGAIVDCSLPEVVGESPQAEAAVRVCLVGENTSACLVGLSGQHRVDTIACVVRRQGWDANRKVLADRPSTDDTAIDEAAKAWIRQEGLGYR